MSRRTDELRQAAADLDAAADRTYSVDRERAMRELADEIRADLEDH